MRIGIILHGPEIVDVGSAGKIIAIFKHDHDVTAKLGGTMGRTAVLDAGLETIIDISEGLTPSETIRSLGNKIDLAILLNHGKTLDTGRYFGRIVASKIGTSLPFVHIERPDQEGRIIYYNIAAKQCAEFVRELLGKHGDNILVEFGRAAPCPVRTDGDDRIIRHIGGALAGENIRIEGVVIGQVTHPEVSIVCKNGRIVELEGVRIKPHGLEKLENRKIDLLTAKVKTGGIRRTRSRPKILDTCSGKASNNIALIDHAAESTFELVKNAGLVITVGDDTTTIAADILTRLGIPVIGIIDGDIDGVIEDALIPAGSVIIRVKSGLDDVVGREISRELMQGKQKIVHDKDELIKKIFAIAGKHVIEATYY